MESKGSLKSIIIEIICYLYVLLFVYAAVSKLLDFENFQVQLGQSPLLNPFAGEISWSVPLFEILTAVLLMIPKYRKVGLMIAFALMVLFTAYIYFILNFSSFVPCSCGGILEKMGWKEHFIFNCLFIALAVTGLLLICKKENKYELRNCYLSLALLALIGIGTIKILLEISENKQFERNNFVRIFPPVSVKRQNTIDLKYNSYYFAGADQHSIYLGNTHSIGFGSGIRQCT
ncbi:MauE/DoxX family redox-associated membrane protein [Flavobacterium ajazii]|uniref:MauE/DoxX family redox-associated membrane protein n=1 Tax=Flavobacterium ajazii TaxID=2692318 RepID=UPI0013D74D93|nr:MauE/DoxX family redox-associated membrane protein [Flavobacterium ajazii]